MRAPPARNARARARARAVALAVMVAVMVAVGVAACGDDGSTRTTEVTLGDFEVAVVEVPPRLTVTTADGRVVWETAAGLDDAEAAGAAPRGLAFRAATATWEMSFGAFRFEEAAAPWRAAARFVGAAVDAEGVLRFALEDRDGEPLGDVSVRAHAPGHLELAARARAPDATRSSITFAAAPDEHFLGLGGQSFDVDHRGWRKPLWVSEDGIAKDDGDQPQNPWFLRGTRHTTHTPIPLTLASRGAAILLDTPGHAIFDLGAERPGDAVTGTPAEPRLEAWQGALSVHLFWGPSPARAIEGASAWIGRARRPPDVAFAPWNDAIFGRANVLSIARQLRAEDVPSSVIWTEDFRGGTNEGPLGYALEEDWRTDDVLYPDLEGLTAELHGLGFHFHTYLNTFLTEGADVFDEALAAGHAVEHADGTPYLFTGVTFRPTGLLDVFDPDAVAWAKGPWAEPMRRGSDGTMADFAEWMPVDGVTEGGPADGEIAHQRYPVRYQEVVRELLDELEAEDGRRRLAFVRSAWLGSQPLVDVIWAGDQQTDFSAGDGLPSVIPIGIGLGLVGFPYYGHDIAGYLSQLTEPSTRELFFRWASLGALTPVMRTHHGRAATDNWSWNRDAETIGHFRRWARLHIRLLPYFRALATEHAATGAPLVRPLAWAWETFQPGWTRTDQYLLGDRLLVAPIVEAGATRRTVELPAATFYPLFGGAPLTEGRHEVEAPLTELPVFVPAGSVLVLLPETIDTLVPADADPGIVTLADVADDRELWLYLGGESTLDEGDGLRYGWTAGLLAAPPTDATWNGALVSFTDGVLDVVGPGTLELDGGGRLTVVGGAPDRRLRVRFP